MKLNPNIVYIEDNKFNIKLIQNLGEKLGLKIKAFENPKEGLEYCKNNDVDLLLVDYMMPELNGIDLVDELKREKPEIPVIMITALDDLKLRKKATLSGIDVFLPKPVNINDFKESIFKLLDDERAVEDTFVKDIIDAEDDLILIIENKKIVHANKTFINFFNYVNENSVDFSFLKMFAIEDKYAWGGNLEEFINSVLRKSNLAKVRKDGDIYFFRVKIAIYKHKGRTIIIFKDITELENLKKRNKELENRVASLNRELRDFKEAGFFEKLKFLFRS